MTSIIIIIIDDDDDRDDEDGDNNNNDDDDNNNDYDYDERLSHWRFLFQHVPFFHALLAGTTMLIVI